VILSLIFICPFFSVPSASSVANKSLSALGQRVKWGKGQCAFVPIRGEDFVSLFFSVFLRVSVVKWSVSVIKICVHQCLSVAPALHSYDSFLIRAIRDSGFLFPVLDFPPCFPVSPVVRWSLVSFYPFTPISLTLCAHLCCPAFHSCDSVLIRAIRDSGFWFMVSRFWFTVLKICVNLRASAVPKLFSFVSPDRSRGQA